MARLRKPSPNEHNMFMPPGATRATRSSPRKAASSVRYDTSSDEENSEILVPKRSTRDLRYNISSQEAKGSVLMPKSAVTSDTLTSRKQRILRPVESNSRLLRKLSDESLASPEKRQRERRVRSGTTDIDPGNNTRLQYAKTLAKSVVKKQFSRTQIHVVEQADLQEAVQRVSQDDIPADVLEVEAEEEAETSLLCADEDDVLQDNEIAPEVESSDEEDDPVMDRRQRQQRLQTRRVDSDSDSDDESEEAMSEPESRKTSSASSQEQVRQTSVEVPQLLRPMRLQHRKGHSTVSNWAQEVIDLSSSPDHSIAPTLPPPTRMRSASFASSRPQTSSSHGGLAMLSYSPTPTKHRSPCKAPPIARPATPPLAPPSPSKLVSPSKKKPAIPKASDLRPSLDAFWNPEVVNEWNERHSPSKPLVSPRKQKWRDDIVKMMEGVALSDDEDSSNSDAEPPSPTTSPQKKTAKPTQPRTTTKKSTRPEAPVPSNPSVKDIRAQRKTFASQKHDLAMSFLSELDATIAQGQIAALSAQTGGIKLIWSKTLKTTAGRANWRREQLRIRTGPLANDFRPEIRHHCSIELAEKVIDEPIRLYNVLAHEYCHLLTFMISNVRNNPHGAEFKSWGKKVSAAFAHRDVEVTTKHSYAIEFKYVWECVTCGYEFKRHSKSVDTTKHSCGKCKGKLVQTKPVPRSRAAEKSEYQVFVKENFARVKKDMEGRGEETKVGKVMEGVAREWRELKGKKAEGDGLEAVMEGLKI
jgi:predicted SprT family Zn-dependent metalloprotease